MRSTVGDSNYSPKPEWLRAPIHAGKSQLATAGVVRRHGLATVCKEARCPNQSECYGRGTAAFMILGSNCTRNCTFCCVEKHVPDPVDPAEPQRVADAVAELGLRYVVVTSVTRDDLPDGGASHFADTVRAIRARSSDTMVELLIPDFAGDWDALATVMAAEPDVLNHNVETVHALYPTVRPQAQYARSLDLLARANDLANNTQTKSGFMLGLGETEEQVVELLEDLRAVHCDALAIGQYLAPSRGHHPVIEYVHPDIFDRYAQVARSMGFTHVSAGPLVRSSYHAEEIVGAR